MFESKKKAETLIALINKAVGAIEASLESFGVIAITMNFDPDCYRFIFPQGVQNGQLQRPFRLA